MTQAPEMEKAVEAAAKALYETQPEFRTNWHGDREAIPFEDLPDGSRRYRLRGMRIALDAAGPLLSYSGRREEVARALYKSRMGLTDKQIEGDFAEYARDPRGYEYTRINVFAAYRDADAILALPATPAGAGWRCFWCNAIFADQREALEHFGRPHGSQEWPDCVLKGIRAAALMRECALQIIADEERFAASDPPGNIELHALRIARVGTAKQILGEIGMSEPVLAGAIAASHVAEKGTQT